MDNEENLEILKNYINEKIKKICRLLYRRSY